MKRFISMYAMIMAFSICAYSQIDTNVGISLGVKGGWPLASPFSLVSFPADNGIPYSAPRNYLVGPMCEVYLPLHLSVEADGLYRPIELAASPFAPVNNMKVRTNFSSWEVPIVAKYRFHTPLLEPFLGVGPSFRITDAGPFSSVGITAAAGAEFRFHKLRFGPEVRFTHWGRDASFSDLPLTGTFGMLSAEPVRTRVNQVALLFGISY